MRKPPRKRPAEKAPQQQPGEASGPAPIKPNGVFAVYKPSDWSSTDVVTRVKNVLDKGYRAQLHKANGGTGKPPRPKRRAKPLVKCGHGGTLDKLATGVLVLGVGNGTKSMKNFLSGNKVYLGKGMLGVATDTLDTEGKVMETLDCSHITKEMVEAALEDFKGDIMQVPPMYSALRVQGKRLYELAREGKQVEREPRPVVIYRLEAIWDDVELPAFKLFVECSGGTYIRTLMADLGAALGSCAHMTSLERQQQGSFTLNECLPKEEWEFETLMSHLAKANEMGPDASITKPNAA
ncbi:unnamed protein product [Chrysoparadoxa australica]